MATGRFKKVLFIRFLGYFIFLTGFLGLGFILGPMVGAEAGYRIDRLKGIKRTVPDMPLPRGEDQSMGFSDIQASPDNIIPVSTEFGIVIEKINANAKIIPDVNPAKESEYVKALQEGVAQALGSTEPGKPGNLYLFSHSTDAPWNIVRYNAIFYLLRELEIGDRTIIFYRNRRYDYVVYDKTVVDPTDVSYLTNRYNEPVLTLQTCDPPGTLLHRLIVRAKLISG